ncbi:MAG: hypothetical protein ACUVR8_06990 [Acidobacteriota bacterium]
MFALLMIKQTSLAGRPAAHWLLAVGLTSVVVGLLASCRTLQLPPPPEFCDLIERFLPQFDGSRERLGQPPLTRQEAEHLLAGSQTEQPWQRQGDLEAFTVIQPVRLGNGRAQCRVTVTALSGQAVVHSVLFQLSGLTDPALADDENRIVDTFVQRYGDPVDVDAPDIDLVWPLPQGGLVLLTTKSGDATATFALRPLSEVPADEALSHGGELRDHD